VLDVAAVIGREFARRVLDRLAGSPESTAQALRELAAAELIHEQSLRPEPTYRFRHAVTHEVAYDALGDSRRTELRAVERPP
jgi:predicted ATPase